MNFKDELYHFGIPGMRWGRRKGSRPLTRSGQRKQQLKKDEVSQNSKLKSMSDDDLRKKITRIQMEKQYKELTATKLQKGQATTKKIIAAATTTAMTTYLAGRIGKAIKAALG